MTTTTPPVRRTPKQIAEDEVARHTEKVEHLVDRITRLKSDLAKAESKLADAERDLAYAKANPRLGEQPQTTTAGTGAFTLNAEES